MASRDVPLQEMQDGQVQDGHKVLSARKRLGMVGVLAVVAGTAVFFNAEEQAAEAKIWDSEMAGIRNATALPDQQNRRFVIANGLSWSTAEEKCTALGVHICAANQVCQEKDKKKEMKDKLKTGGRKSRLTKQLCKAKGWTPNWKKGKKKAGHAGKMSVCKHSEEADLANRWLPMADGNNHVWANIKTCETKPSVVGEKEQGVIACCGAHTGGLALFSAVHPPQILVAAAKVVKQRKDGKTGSKDDEWSKHEYIDKMRSSDPFLAHKQKGTKMKAMHDHVADKAPEYLGNATVTAMVDGVQNFHDKMKTHINSVVDALKAGSNSTQIGAVSGALKTSDPRNSYKMAPLATMAARNGSSSIVNMMSTTKTAIKQSKSQFGQGGKKSKSPFGGSFGKQGPPLPGFGKKQGPPLPPSTRALSYGKVAGKMPGAGPGGSVETRRPMMMGSGN